MQQKIMSIFTRTPMHVGAGASVGAVDQPIIREKHTGFPVIPGSAVKGVLRNYVHSEDTLKNEEEKLFGHEPENMEEVACAGKLGFGEAKLLAFPLRSAKGSFALVTCPLALSRYARDKELTYPVPAVNDQKCLAASGIILEDKEAHEEKVAIEEYIFHVTGPFPQNWAEHLSGMLDDAVLKEGKTHFVLLSDGDFSHFVQNTCPVQYHNRIGENGTVVEGQLFNTETVPSETLLYAPIYIIRKEANGSHLFTYFSIEKLLKFGGDNTTGLGFSTVKIS